ncbi:hypothetical protein NEMBOFW57_000639 [Staphylotrichum longicolle]|uniref:Inositol-pentakisphosphate 2-kinase n=1 Tax=Staphylotrichum longicolle TaxID=669026 RepID=A0AAD4EZS2_9PEZI|nr:hypothetical protein NEMBOFW57_000639 [Staphylotrichum longicolle]
MASATQVSSVPVLPITAGNNCKFKFVGEGAANFVFEVLVPPSDEPRDNPCNLLRVPKAGTKAHSHVELQEYWKTVVAPLFEPDHLVQHQLVKLGDEGLVSRLNAVLDEEEHTRRSDFKGSRVALAEYGMLVEDMRQKFKPKWLAQSPNAPSSATRCRNCAREALKHHTKPASHRKPNHAVLCPLNFLTCSTSPPALANILTHLFADEPPTPSQVAQRNRLIHWLQTNTLLPRLRAAQESNDRNGPLGASAEDRQFQLAMTLRDCTCFVRIPADPALPVEAKLADLDKKNSVAKLGYWQAMERELIDGGYYEGREVPLVRTDCQLEKGVVT